MGQLPISVWATIAGVALVLIALCVATLVAALRAPARQRIARWSVVFLLELLALAVVPWLVVIFAPVKISLKIDGLLPLLAWMLVALLAFALLVLLPLAAVAASLVWWTARRRRVQPPAISSHEPPT